MNIDKAIDILSVDITYTYPVHFKELQNAIRLGIEALKEVKDARYGNPALDGELLPGETED